MNAEGDRTPFMQTNFYQLKLLRICKKLHFQKFIDIYALKITSIEIASLITLNNFVTATGRT